ncbi:MAG: 23S rRNA (pseudouridine(1915)-N(3))-methyltransferase RlmH [Rhodobiaceae bacterium]|nr:23S rRNA (pseudouridine(1915)-N(3))-methyltransferase RlmH [Rhodobiaceae bacterium]MCC0056717.1 23S rRNA (pseudouridine(1915)-N(3))-methyltransferase RlmH [Rhodobiaceae bacterium]
MKISVLSVGRIGSGPEATLCEDYARRAAPLLRTLGMRGPDLAEMRESRRDNSTQRRDEEAEALLRRIPDGATIIALDEGGKQLASREFAGLIETAAAAGTAEIAFVIGGPDGHGDAVMKRANRTIAFGAMTWPHKLVRAALCEQIYRAATILAGHPYHRD